MAEGARFELADPLRGLQFSRLARSATPSPLHTMLAPTRSPYQCSWRRDNTLSVSFFLDPFHPPHVTAQDLWNQDAPVRLLVVFQDGYDGAAHGKSGAVESMNTLHFCILFP
jgi:hypothetical protein